MNPDSGWQFRTPPWKGGASAAGQAPQFSVECRHARGRCGGVGVVQHHLGKVGLRRPGSLHSSSVECCPCPRTLRRRFGFIRTSPWKGGASPPGSFDSPSVECRYTRGRCGGVAGWSGPHLGKVGPRRRAAPQFSVECLVAPVDAAAAFRVDEDPTLEKWGFAAGQAPQFSVECWYTVDAAAAFSG